MLKRYLYAAFLFGLAAVMLTPESTLAQAIRPEQTLYIKPRVGISWHLGDTEKSPGNFNMDNWKVDGKFPYAAGLELGYQFNQSASLSLGYQLSNHPLIFHYGDTVPDGVDNDETMFHSAQLLFRIGAQSRVAPFFAIGGHAMFNNDDRASTAFGPAVGLGLDIAVSDRTSLVFEWLSNLTFPDDAADGMDANVFGDDFAPFDALSTVTLGLKYNFKSAFTPVDVMSVDCPGRIQLGQSATFTASVNEEAATKPLEYRWDFGDGNTATGLLATHTFDRTGTYNVTFTANNRGSTDTEACSVEVFAPAPQVTSISANPMTFEVCEPTTVSFSANVNLGGGPAVTYSWDFGDGSTGTGANPTHTYSTAGNYTVTLTATNEGGSDTRSITVTAQPCTSICADITELNSVYFGHNSSTLTPEGRAALQENIEILRECPDLCVRIEGFAAPGERNAQRLSEDRARAVEQFYIDNGVAGSRLLTIGMGRVGGMTSKKEGASQFRRVDSLPMPCDQMGSK